MRVAVPTEVVSGERRVALVPDVVRRLVQAGFGIVVERGAGDRAGFPDAAYVAAGAEIVADPEAVFGADCVLKVQRPTMRDELGRDETDLLRSGAILVSFLYPQTCPPAMARLAERGVASFGLELVPRITRAQKMDALSSQSTVAGYKATLLAANATGKFFPMLMTAAGTVTPSRVLVLGAGVAGLQAIATARRLGAVVEAADTRPATKEQVESLGASFVSLDVSHEEAQDAGGYAKALAEDHLAKEQEIIRAHAAKADVVITTALVPGRRAPILIPTSTVEAMGPGSVIVDLAAEMGGNCEVTRPGETVVHRGVSVLAPLNLPSQMPYHASQMFARNIAALLEHLAPGGEAKIDLEDEITRGCCVTFQGEVVHAPTRALLEKEVTA
ncbi:MAG TPA: Re/Si-specific NAD(P)(+) transhydrogenase subunit alpha [Longimicrobiales bacterium]|nr:Re/Si-specific NAD(P)(+) transhydrogenase subunit alpha [Longimicrobiales bacterium]